MRTFSMITLFSSNKQADNALTIHNKSEIWSSTTNGYLQHLTRTGPKHLHIL